MPALRRLLQTENCARAEGASIRRSAVHRAIGSDRHPGRWSGSVRTGGAEGVDDFLLPSPTLFGRQLIDRARAIGPAALGRPVNIPVGIESQPAMGPVAVPVRTCELIENCFLAGRRQHEHSSGGIGPAGSSCSVEIPFCVADEIIAPGSTTITATLKVPQ